MSASKESLAKLWSAYSAPNPEKAAINQAAQELLDLLKRENELPDAENLGDRKLKLPVGIDGVIEVTAGNTYGGGGTGKYDVHPGKSVVEDADLKWVFPTSRGSFIHTDPTDSAVTSWTSVAAFNKLTFPTFK